ncbi:unnamed protein product [Schistosoma turkestanicum]|nr:unnamed protein product [Schistosoma turkestanicum]
MLSQMNWLNSSSILGYAVVGTLIFLLTITLCTCCFRRKCKKKTVRMYSIIESGDNSEDELM